MARPAGAVADDSQFDASIFDRILEARPPTRWMGWRLRALIVASLIGCLAMFALMRMLAATPRVDAQWEIGARGSYVLRAARDPVLNEHAGRVLVAVSSPRTGRIDVSGAALGRSARWIVSDDDRARQAVARAAVARALEGSALTLEFDGGRPVTVQPQPRGFAGLPLVFWLLAALALLVYVVGVSVLMAKPQLRNVLYAVMALCQAVTLLWFGVDAVEGLVVPFGPGGDTLPWRLALDVCTAAAIVHSFALQPLRLARHTQIGVAVWTIAALAAASAWRAPVDGLWWWGQALTLWFGLCALLVLSTSYRVEPNPFAAVMRRFGYLSLGTLAVITLAVGAAYWQPGVPYGVATAAAVVWYVFFASLLLMVPFLSAGRKLLREFAMLAGLSTVATSLDLLFVSVFSLGQFTSLTLAVFVALGAYAAARQWVLNKLLGTALVTTERTFEQLYRVAREVQQHPERHAGLLARLLRDLFDPIEVLPVARAVARARVVGDGSALVVPIADPARPGDGGVASLMLRFAGRGQRIFTREDARLTDRVVEQLRRAVAYDEAVERGRAEERLRIAQDLHDDIGARLLTLMYKAQNPEMEDYLRHTLQDLKTLTRGLAASEHRMSHAVAEWKADLQQRLTAARVHLAWTFGIDRDVALTVVQWSALTRVLRELVSNAIVHAQATRVEVTGSLDKGSLTLSVADDGIGRAPQAWSHGLGLGGVRKRVKLLGGTVQWRENGARGIVCEVQVPELVRAEPG